MHTSISNSRALLDAVKGTSVYRWVRLGDLPKPPTIEGEITVESVVQSIHMLSQNRILVSYKDGIAL